ncbi:hypothetical protein ACFLTP_05105 [Chloroflexota bacterium]
MSETGFFLPRQPEWHDYRTRAYLHKHDVCLTENYKLDIPLMASQGGLKINRKLLFFVSSINSSIYFRQ